MSEGRNQTGYFLRDQGAEQTSGDCLGYGQRLEAPESLSDGRVCVQRRPTPFKDCE